MSEVLVVGAGPVGLFAALQLRRWGVNVDIIDKRDLPSQWSKALGVMPRTLEYLGASGVADKILDDGRAMRHVRFHRNGELAVDLEFDSVDSHYDRITILPQNRTELHLANALVEAGGSVERGVELVSLEQDGSGVDVTLSDADGNKKRRRYYWVIGCDGAHSVVRSELGIEFEGAAIEGLFKMVDCAATSSKLDPTTISIFSGEDSVVATFPLPDGIYRILTEVPLEDGDEVTDALMQSAMDKVGIGGELGEVSWRSAFRVQSRVASAYRKDRVFLAGDAAHSHSPLGGQGMNMGLQDAGTIAWMLAGVTQGRFNPGILDAYEQERRPIAEAVVGATDRGTKTVLVNHNTAKWGLMRTALGVVSNVKTARKFVTEELAGLHWHYESPIIVENSAGLLGARIGAAEAAETPNVWAAADFRAAPQAGDRMPNTEIVVEERARDLIDFVGDLHHTVLMFDGRAQTDEGYRGMAEVCEFFAERSDVQVLAFVPEAQVRLACAQAIDDDYSNHAAFGASSESLYVIRPDGVVGYRQQPIDLASLKAWWESFST